MVRKGKTHLIGTPIAEGVRFELNETVSLAVRNADHDIAVHVYPQTHFFRDLFAGLPLVRGIVRLFSSIGRLLSGLKNSAPLNPQISVRGSARTKRIAKLYQTTPQNLAEVGDVLLIPIIFLICLWGIPFLIGQLLGLIPDIPRYAVNAVCCAFRIAGLSLSVATIARIKLVNRLAMYRGAIAKVKNAYEIFGFNLTDAEVSRSSILTESSDGVFALIALSLAIIGFALVRTTSFGMTIAVRICIILLSSAITDELLLPIESARTDTVFARLRRRISRIQLLFTLDPHPQMTEVALCALRAAAENDLSDIIDE